MPLGRRYAVVFPATVTGAGVSIAAQQDFFYIKPAADKICIIESVVVTNVGIALDAGDTQEELWDVQLIRVPATVTVGSGGAAMTPTPLATNDTAASFTARVNDTTKATSSGTILPGPIVPFNVRVGCEYLPIPEHRMIVANAQAVVFRLDSTPTDAVLMNGTMIVQELP